MRSISIRRKTGCRSNNGFRIAAITIVVLGICCIASFFESVMAFSTTTPTTATKTPSSADSDSASVAISPNERSEILNQHLQKELSSDDDDDDIGGEIMEAALLSAKDLPPSSNGNSNNRRFRTYDPRFGRPALKAYRSFVYSDKHSADPILLDGLAIKTAKHIRNMIKQTRNLADGIVSPPKNNENSNANANAPQHFREKIANSIAKGERRARERGHTTLREVCTGCSRPFNLCLCEVLSQLNNNNNNNNNNTSSSNETKVTATATKASDWMVYSRVIVLQHPNEFRKKHTSTVPLLKLVLGDENVKMKVGYEFTMKDIFDKNTDGDIDIDIDDMDEQRPIMLFPGPDAIDLDQYVAEIDDDVDCSNRTSTTSISTTTESLNQKEHPPKKKKHTLVLIDGTWSEAKRIIRKSPEVLENCQMVQFAFSDDDLETDHQTNPNVDDEDEYRASLWPSNPESDCDKATKSRSIYHAMRKEPEEHCLSTLEACGEALKFLEGSTNGPKLQHALNAVLTKHVELHLKNAKEASHSRHNRDTTSRDSKLKRSKEIERAIYGEKNDDTDVGASKSHSSSSSKPSERSCIYGGKDAASFSAIKPTTISGTPTRLLALDSNDSITNVNVKLRRLTHEDIPVVDALWDNGGQKKSIMTITRSIDADYRLDIGASLGIVDDNDDNILVACILRYESGPLGILHVSEEHRGKGYATTLLKEATKLVTEAELECMAFIKDGNTASERVFTKTGYVRENPNAKRGTGKRKAKRKWIYPATLLQKEKGEASDDTTTRT